jgi:predicted RNA-binding protein associated with RNAse of E/G family
MDITIHYNRIMGPSLIYHETLLEETPHRLQTQAIMNNGIRDALTRGLQRNGVLKSHQRVHELEKQHFFDRAFNVLKFYDPLGEVLGYYSDICTPLTKIGDGHYATTDLILDLWVSPNRSTLELDWDEFDHATQNELLSPELQTLAKTTLTRLQHDVVVGVYPDGYG